MVQVYINDENTVNNWLYDNEADIEVMDVKLAIDNDNNEVVMVVYKKY